MWKTLRNWQRVSMILAIKRLITIIRLMIIIITTSPGPVPLTGKLTVENICFLFTGDPNSTLFFQYGENPPLGVMPLDQRTPYSCTG